MADAVLASAAAWVAETWSAQLAEATEAMTGERPEAIAKPAEGESPAGLLWWHHPLSLGPQAAIWIGVPERSWLAIGKHLLQSAGIETGEPADARNTFLEISSQAVSGLCQAASARLGTNVSSEGGREAAPVAGASLFEIALKLGTDSLPLYAGVSPALAEALDAGRAPTGTNADGLAQDAGPAGERPSGPRKNEPGPLDLVMEVELAVSVSFGRAELALRDVLKLTTGSIVELNRGLTDPVEVIVNNCVIARGEVVVIEGNYGVRIQEIVSREKRVGTPR